MEVYVDDILIKSFQATDLCADIKETCQTLRSYEIKLNPGKCLFSAKSGKFLGYIVNERAKPVVGEPLRIYLSSTEHAIGSALVRSNGEEQPVYFLSHILKDVESRYICLKKLAFALVLAAQRLLPYFLAHTTIVMTNSPLGRVLLNPEAFGRLIKWTTELNEFDIQYQPRTTIRAQSLADFVTEVQNPEPEATWKVFVDGSSTRQGSGMDILLISPPGRADASVRSVRLSATNNEAEYETLIVGIQAAWLYADAFEKLKASFHKVIIRKIPHSENLAVDELAKLASSITPIVIQQPIEQISLVVYIDQMEGLTFPDDWRTVLIEFLRTGFVPTDREGAHTLRRRAGRFTLIGDQLYKKAFSRPLLKCVSPEDVDYILKEEDATRIVATCLSCQRYHNSSHRPTEEMKSSVVSCPFDQWGMDIVGSFPMAIGQRKFLLVAIDYFSKWVEAEPLARITE
ncbi:uncharacterized protein LOC122022872 [Zingiber officinale]|uniref:uncharacterized protein LOC122022872 n=1 Tax=Zingiber officinale TaxID=94328 RepID=UPI001C4B493B|nr:uncharacterized protein LOC122022872 [Zingiber officinale]